MRRITVLIAAKADIFREGLSKILESEPRLEVVAKCSSGLEAIEKAIEYHPEVILLDDEITEGECIEVVRRICDSTIGSRIIILTSANKVDGAMPTLNKTRVRAYLAKDVEDHRLYGAIERVATGEVVISPSIATKLVDELSLFEKNEPEDQWNHNYGLTKREEEILALVAKGSTNKQIASALFITENTVKTHLRSILEKMHVSNRHQAALLMRKYDLIPEITCLK